MVPHSIVDGVARHRRRCPGCRGWPPTATWRRLGGQVAATLRTGLALIVPFALLLPADRAAPVRHRLGLRRRQRDLHRLRRLAGAVRARPGLLHRPLPDAARLLRAGAHPDRLLGAVRDRRGQRRRAALAGHRTHRPAGHRAGLVPPTACAYAVGAADVVPRAAARLGGLETHATVRFAGADRASPRPSRRRRVGLPRWLLDLVWPLGDGKVQAVRVPAGRHRWSTSRWCSSLAAG